MDSGEYCSGWELYWYYDTENTQCRQFYYGGCAGNKNRFTSEEDCADVCPEFEQTPPSIMTGESYRKIVYALLNSLRSVVNINYINF